MNPALRAALSPLPVAVSQSQLLVSRNLGQGNAHGSQNVPVPRDPTELAITMQPAGPCPHGGTTVFIVLDESASVTAGGGNDPLSRRHAETALAIRHVASACRCRKDRVALVPFDRGSAGYVAPQPLTVQGVRRLTRGLERLSGGWGLSSELDPPLSDVENQVGQVRGAVAVVVFSDFLLTDTNPSAVVSRLRSFPGYVHAVVLGALPPAVLVTDPTVAVSRLTPSSKPGSAARAVFDGLNHYRRHGPPTAGSAAHHTVNKKEHTP